MQKNQKGCGGSIKFRNGGATISSIRNDGFPEHDLEIESPSYSIGLQMDTASHLLLLDQ